MPSFEESGRRNTASVMIAVMIAACFSLSPPPDAGEIKEGKGGRKYVYVRRVLVVRFEERRRNALMYFSYFSRLTMLRP